MTPYYTIFKSYQAAVLFMLLMVFAGCSGLPSKKPIGDGQVPRQFPDIDVYKQKSDDTHVSLIKILSSEAEKFLWQGQYQDALFVYNQAYVLADPLVADRLLLDIEKALEQSPAKEIKEFSSIKNINIPKPLLVYWLGVNYGLENKPSLSRQTLELFLKQYPEHRYAADAEALVSIIGTAYFDSDTIGCLLPLSGKYAAFGQRALSGIQLAVQDMSRKYNRSFKLIIKDTKADPVVTARSVRQLNQMNVSAIIGPLLNVLEAGTEAQDLKIPLIAFTQKEEFPLQGDYLFANFINPRMQVRTLGDYLFGNLGVKKAAILYPDEKYGEKHMSLFWDIADEYGVTIVGVESYDGKKTDFSDPIKKLTGEYYPLPEFLIEEAPEMSQKTEMESSGDEQGLELDTDRVVSVRSREKEEKVEIDFEALFIPDSHSKVKLILPQLAFNDATGIYLVGTNLWHHDDLLKDARGYTKQAVIADGFFSGSRNPATVEFTRQYKALFEKTPGFLEAVAYDTAGILFSGLADVDVDSREALKDSLRSGRVFQGATGMTAFDADGTAVRELFLMTIKRGRFEEISR